MERDDRRRAREITEQVAGWADRARSAMRRRTVIEGEASEAAAALQRSAIALRRNGALAWHTLPLRNRDSHSVNRVRRATQLPHIEADGLQIIDWLGQDATRAVHDARSVHGARRLVISGGQRAAGLAAVEWLTAFHDWAQAANVPDVVARLESLDDSSQPIGVSDALADSVGLATRLCGLGRDPQLLPASLVGELPAAVGVINQALQEEARFRLAAVEAARRVRRAETRRLLEHMSVERLKEATGGRVRVGPLIGAGVTTVQAVLDRGAGIEQVPGVGPTTATRVRGAAQSLWQSVYDEMPTRIDVDHRTPATTELVLRLSAWDQMRRTRGAADDIRRAAELAPLARGIGAETTHVLAFMAAEQPIDTLRDDIQAVLQRARTIASRPRDVQVVDPWEDFLRRPADYYAMLAELGLRLEDEQKTHGDLPKDIIDAVRAFELDTEHLSASLRGYQSFGARFALVQRRVIIGDEMGLGKTIEALAVIAHIQARGSHHAVVVCPAAVVTNWIREVEAKSTLSAHRLHGPGRGQAAQAWARSGGVAVTTFETLGWFQDHASPMPEVGCVVVDEAHYIKNPHARRSQHASGLLKSVDHALLLTGTPLENRVEEFRNLVHYLRPDLVVDAGELTSSRFRRQVAPAYLRRNQEDVLLELPEVVEVNELLPMTPADASAYRDAVLAGNFMAMRQAAMLQGRRSAKGARLIEIVAEAEQNERRVIVFSHFRDVLDRVARILPGQVFGPLTGSVPAAARQVMVDQFSAAGHGAVLVSQILAGGIGLNIQAASVVIICEPQLKPTTEWQAIARARRMGQLKSVQVHRLVSEDGVDQRITEILAHKRGLFEDVAQVSEIAHSAPEAFDISEAELARAVVAQERERLFPEAPSDEPDRGLATAASTG